jgi:hypothetical protein
MQSVIVAMLSPPDSPEAALLVRRVDGQFALERVDARLAAAARVAANWFRRNAVAVAAQTGAHRAVASADGDPGSLAVTGLKTD